MATGTAELQEMLDEVNASIRTLIRNPVKKYVVMGTENTHYDIEQLRQWRSDIQKELLAAGGTMFKPVRMLGVR